jgi:hypothetical protein
MAWSLGEIVHFVVLGPEPLPIHTAGVSRFGAKEVVLFVPEGGGGSLSQRQKEVEALSAYGTPVRPVDSPASYRGAVPVAFREVEGYIESGACIGINGGSGNRGVVQAIIDATLASLLEFHPSSAKNDDNAAGAFRYYPSPSGDRADLDIAPLFNVANERHREIVVTLLQQDGPISGKELHDAVNASQAPESRCTYDNFRHHLYSVRRWLKLVPGFHEDKGDRFRYRLEGRQAPPPKNSPEPPMYAMEARGRIL